MVQETGDNRTIFLGVETTKTVHIIKFNVVLDFKLLIYEVTEFPFCVLVVRLISKAGKDNVIFQ